MIDDRPETGIAGDAGLGKTTLADLFGARVATPTAWCRARGEGVEHHGAGEAYLPVLDAVGQLCRGPAHGRVLELLQQRAPTWLVQLPWFLSPAALEAVQHQVQTASRERMLREMAALLEALTAETPVVLVLEDLHWSDYATVDLIAWLGRRREPARLMLVGTYRPVELIVHDHPLRGVTHELRLHRQCEEVLLEWLSEADVARYLMARFHDRPLSPEAIRSLARAIHQRTDGHPFFMVTLVDLTRHLAKRDISARGAAAEALGWMAPAATPEILAALRRLLHDPEWGARWAATEAKGQMGQAAAVPEVLSVLVKLMTDPQRSIRPVVTATLENLSSFVPHWHRAETVRLFLPLTSSRDQEQRNTAYVALRIVFAAGPA